ncbi:helix-turn-helix domain-containing protein [Psychrobacillus sp. L3]|uniref:helix-turn-helix domain-containing protein n=1 Tax=Psychrobacillus sp. L3 TaxID=3236891 RepID=UPI0036F1AC0C
MKEKNDFGKFLRELRTNQKLSIRALSESAGVSHSYLSQVENGNRGVPSPEVIRKIADALEYDYFAIMRVAGHMSTNESKDYMKSDFFLTMIEKISFEGKKFFISRFREAAWRINRSLNKDEEQYFNKSVLNLNDLDDMDYFLKGGKLENVDEEFERELEVFLLTNFSNYAKPSDYLILLRLYRGFSIEEISKKMSVDTKFYKENEENIELYHSSFLADWSKTLGEILGVDDLQEWLTRQPGISRAFINKLQVLQDEEKLNNVKITFERPRFQKLEGDKQETELSPEEVKEQFLYLENLLTMEENIYLNKRILSKHEKEKALQILKLIFEDTPNYSNNQE